jgi:hypothetical protein
MHEKMSEKELLVELSSKIGKTDNELRKKFNEIYKTLSKRSLEERLKMAKDALQAYDRRR